MIKKIIGYLAVLHRVGCFRPRTFIRFIHYNYRKNTRKRKKCYHIMIAPYTRIDIKRSSKINAETPFIIGFKKNKYSHLETSLWMDENAELNIGRGGCTIYDGCDILIFKNAKLTIGGCSINRNSQIICQEEISIGKQCMISRDVIIRDNDGGHRICIEGYQKTSPINIGDHVWIGQGAIILKGTTIGDGSIIGAGAIVSGIVKPNSLVMADPARVFKKDISWEYK